MVLVDYDQEPSTAQTLFTSGDRTTYEALVNASLMLSCGGDEVMTPEEVRFEKHLRKMRNRMLLELEAFPYASPEAFFSHRTSIEGSALFGIFRRMPKGGSLHLHLSLAGNYTWVAETLVSSWWDRLYVDPDTMAFWLSNRTALEPVSSFYDRDSRSLLALFQLPHIGSWQSTDAWDAFVRLHARIEHIFEYGPFLEAYIDSLLRLFQDDGYTYVELKQTLGGKYDDDGPWTITEELAMYDRIKRRAPIAFELVVTGDRHRSAAELYDEAMTTVDHDVLAYDVVNEEDRGHSHVEHFETFEALALAKIRLVLHSGETAFPRDTNRKRPLETYDADIYSPRRNVVAALQVGALRVGHNLASGRDVILARAYAASGTCTAVNPLSNAILRYQVDLRSHPAQTLCSANATLVISNDDNGALGTNPPTHDLLAAYISWGLDLAQLKAIFKYSLSPACAVVHPTKLASLRDQFLIDWTAFVHRTSASLDDDDDDDSLDDDSLAWTPTDEAEHRRWADLHSAPLPQRCANGALVVPKFQCRCFTGYHGTHCEHPTTRLTNLLGSSLAHDLLVNIAVAIVAVAATIATTRGFFKRHRYDDDPSLDHDTTKDVMLPQEDDDDDESKEEGVY